MAESDVTDNPKLFGVRGLVAAWSTSAAAFAGFSLLLPVVPWAIAQEGGSDTVAGSVTAVFMFTTVLTQIAMPALLRRFGHRATLVAGCLFLGPPSLLFLVSMEPAAALGISAIRGIGFGMITVASAALVGELAPARLLGRATGMLGIAIAASQMIGLPTGLALAERFSTTPVFVLGAVLSSAGLIAAARLPRLEARTGPRPARMPFVLLLLPTVAVGAGAIAYGGLTSLLAIAVADLPVAAALAVLSGSTLVGRFGAGAVADRIGAGRMLPVGLGTRCARDGAVRARRRRPGRRRGSHRGGGVLRTRVRRRAERGAAHRVPPSGLRTYRFGQRRVEHRIRRRHRSGLVRTRCDRGFRRLSHGVHCRCGARPGPPAPGSARRSLGASRASNRSPNVPARTRQHPATAQ